MILYVSKHFISSEVSRINTKMINFGKKKKFQIFFGPVGGQWKREDWSFAAFFKFCSLEIR